jgi:hypothetical protein
MNDNLVVESHPQFRRNIKIVTLNPQPDPEPPIPFCADSIAFQPSGVRRATYQTVPYARPIKLTNGFVVIEEHHDGRGCASPLMLGAPKAGDTFVRQGEDGHVLRIRSHCAYAHVITTPAGVIGGKHDRIEFEPVIGATIELLAMGGIWYPMNQNRVKVS